MPDLINPILDFNSSEIPDIPVAIPDSKGANFEMPSEILAAKQQLQKIPANQLTGPLFSEIVKGTKVEQTPEQLKKSSLDKASEGYNPSPLQGDSFAFTNYKSEDSLRYRQNKRLFEKIGYNPIVSVDVLDAQYDNTETTWESFKNVIPKLWATSKFAYTNYFQEYLDTASAIHHLDSKLLYNDDRFTKHADYLQELETLYPNYQTDRPGSGFGQLFTGDFWEESAPSLGFTLGTAAAAITEGYAAAALAMPTGGLSVAAEAINTPRKIFKAISQYFSLKTAYNLLKTVGVNIKTAQIATTLKAGANIWRLTNGALAEASLEGALNKKEYVEGFIQEYIQENGVRPSDELIAKAAVQGDKMAKSTILFQTPFLMASNAVQLGNLVAPRAIGQLFEKYGIKKGAWELINNKATFDIGVQATAKMPTTMFGKVSQKAVPFVRGAIWEGSEESYQALVTKTTADYYNDQVFSKNNGDLFKSVGAGFDYVTSNEGLKEFLAGFATGSMFTGIKMPIDYFSKIKPTINPTTGETEYKKNLLNKMGFGMDSYYKDIEKEKFQKIADNLNANDVFKVFGEEGFLNASKDKQTEFMLAKFLENGDMFNMQHAQNLQLMRMLYSGLSTGKVDMQIQRINDFANQDFSTLSEFLETRGITDEVDQNKWSENFKAFAQNIGEQKKTMEQSFNATQKENETYTKKINGELKQTTQLFNSALIQMRQKYQLAEDASFEQIKAAANQDDQLQLSLLNRLNLNASIKYVTSQEMLKMQVFAQMGMATHADKSRKHISDLNNVEDLNYSNIEDLFDNPSRAKKIKQLKDDIETTKISGDTERVEELQKDLDNLEKIDKHVSEKFSNKQDFDVQQLAALISGYVRNQRGQENKKPWSTNFESSETTKLLEEYVVLQNRFQENLNLFNTLTQQLKGENPEVYMSKRVIEFLEEAITKKEENTKVQASKTPAAATPKDTPPPPPIIPTALYDKKDSNLDIKRNPALLRALWFPNGKTKEATQTITSTYNTDEVNLDVRGEVVKNTGSKDRIVNFETKDYMVVFTPQEDIFQFYTTINGERVELGRMQDPASVVVYRKVGKDWVKLDFNSITLDDFKAVFSTPGATTEEQFSEEFNKFLQNAANLNSIKNQMKAGKEIKDLAKVILSLGNFDFVEQGYGSEFSELIKSLPSTIKVLASLSKETNKPVLLFTTPGLTESELVTAAEFLDAVNNTKDNVQKTTLNKLGRYSALVQTPNGVKLIELHAPTFEKQEIDNFFTVIKMQSDKSVANNLDDKGNAVLNTFNNSFQSETLDKIFLSVDNKNLFKKGFQVRLIINPNGSVRLGLSKKNNKGEVVDLFRGGTKDKLNIIITTKELESITTIDQLLESFNKKLGDKKLKNTEANSVILTRNSFKVSVDKDFSYDMSLQLVTKLQGTGFKNPTIRLEALKDTAFTRASKPINTTSQVSTPPAFNINDYKGKKFNFRKLDGKVVEVIVQGLTAANNIRLQYTPGDKTGDWSISLFLQNMTNDPLSDVVTIVNTTSTPAEKTRTRDTSKINYDSDYQDDFSFLDMMSLSLKQSLLLTSNKLQIDTAGNTNVDKLEKEWDNGMLEVEEMIARLIKDTDFTTYFKGIDQNSKDFQKTRNDLYAIINEYFTGMPFSQEEKLKYLQRILYAVVYDNYLRTVPEVIAEEVVTATEEITPIVVDERDESESDELSVLDENRKDSLALRTEDEIKKGFSTGIVFENGLYLSNIYNEQNNLTATISDSTLEGVQKKINDTYDELIPIDDDFESSKKSTTTDESSTVGPITFDPNDLNDQKQEDEDDEPPFKIVDSTYNIQDERDNLEFITFMKRVMPDGVFSHKELNKIGERLSNGNIKVGRFLATLKDVSEGIKGSIETVGSEFKYHEAFHGIYRLLLTTKEQNTLQASAIEDIYKELSKKGTSLNKELESFRNSYPEKYGLMSTDNLKRLYIEEWLADKFDVFESNNSKNKEKNVIVRFFQNLFNLIKNIFNRTSDNPFSTQNEINKFFRDADRGVFKNRQVQLNPFTEKLYEEGYGEVEANKIKIAKGRNDKGKMLYDYLSDSDTYAAIGTVFTSFISDVENKGFHNKSQVLEEILNDLRDSVKEDYDAATPAGKEVLQDILSLYTADASREALKQEVNKHLEYIGYSQTLESDKVEELSDDIGDRRTTENFSDSENFGGFKSLSKEVRQYLATVNSPYQFSNGRTATNAGRMLYSQLFLPFIYNGVLKSTAGTTNDVDFLEKLRQFAKYNVNTKVFVQKFFKDIFDTSAMVDSNNLDEYDVANPSSIVNTTLFQLFRNNFKTMSLTYKIVGYDISKKQAVIINANTKNSARLQFQKWANGFIYKKNNSNSKNTFILSANAAFSSLEKSLKDTTLTSQQALELSVRHSDEILANTGMKFHPLLIRLSLLKNVIGEKTKEDITLESLYSDVLPIDYRDINNIARSIGHGQNPFLAFFEVSVLDNQEEVNLKETGSKTRLLTIAVENAKLDEFVWDSVFVNAEKKKVWTHQSPTYSSTVFKEIQQGSVTPENSTLFERDEFQSVLPFINLERNGGITTISLSAEGEINNNLQVNKNPGTTYGGLDTRSLYISLLSNYFDSRVVNGVTLTPHLTRILEASNTGNMIQLPVLKTLNTSTQVSDEILDILEKEFMNEVDNISKVFKQLTGKVDEKFERIKGYNDGDITLERNNKKYPRGAKFFAFQEILGIDNAIIYEQLIADAVAADVEGSPFSVSEIKDLRVLFNNYFFKNNGLVNNVINDMMSEGLISKDNKGEYESRFIPNDFFGNFTQGNKAKAKSLYLTDKKVGAFEENIAQFVINDFINTMMYNNMIYKYHGELFKDSVDIIKRAKGENAGGASIYSELINPSFGIHHPTTAFDLIVKPTEEYYSELKGESQDRMDAESYISEKMFRHIMFALGRLDKKTAGIYDKITNGVEDISDIFGKDGLIEYNRQTNVLKLVYFDGMSGTYIKTSALVLTKKLTAYQTEDDNWVELPHRKKLNTLREELEFLESNGDDLSKGKLVWVVTSSASKMRSILSTNGRFENLIGNEETVQKDLSTKYLRLQVENPSNKKTGIIDPTQFKNIIDTEQNPDQIVKGYTNKENKPLSVKDIQNYYQADSRQRLKLNYLLGRNAIFDISTEEGREDLMHEVTANIKQNRISPKLDKFKKIAVETLKSSGASSQTISFFEGDFEMNSPFVREKFENLISAFFTNYGFKEKIPGHSFTLASDVGMKVVKKAKVRYVGEKRIVEWVVIPTTNVVSLLKKNSDILKGVKEYSTPLLSSNIKELSNFRKAFQDSIIDGEFFIDELQHNVPVYDEAGDITEYYTEVIIPAHHREIEEMLRKGQAIPMEILAMFGVRIPSQDKSSAMSIRVVDFAPAHLGSTLWGAKELIEVSGADFDVDKLYAQMVDMYFKKSKDSSGKTITTVHQFGEASNTIEEYDEYLIYHLKNNRLLKENISTVRSELPRLTEVNLELKTLEKENDLVSQDFQKKITESWEKHITEQVIPENTPAPINRLEIEMSISNLEAQLAGEKNFKKISRIKFALTEQQRLLSEASGNHSNEEDQSGVADSLIEHKRLIGQRIEFWEGINNRIESLKQERRKLINYSEKEGLRLTGLATNQVELQKWNNEYGEQNPGVLNNLLLKWKTLLQSNVHIVENGLDSDPATLSIFNDFKEDSDISRFLGLDVALNPDTLLGKIKHQKSNKEGASNIGPAVNTMLVYTLFHKYGVHLKKGEEITIDNVQYFDYLKDTTSTGNRIFKVISQVVTAMTDNAKERIAFKHNLTLDSIPVFVHMVSLGISEKIAQALLLNPAVKEYYAQVRESKLTVKDLKLTSSIASIKGAILSKYKVDEAMGYDYTTENIVGSLNNPTDEDNHHLLKLLFKLEAQVMPFSDVLNIVKLPKGLYNGFSTFRDLQTSMEKLELRESVNRKSLFEESEEFPWEGLDTAMESHYTGQMLKQTDQLSIVSKQLSIPITDIFNKLIHSIYNQVNVKRYNREKFYKDVINDYLSFLSARIYVNNKKESKIGKMLNSSILVGDESLGKLILEARKVYTDIFPGRTSTLLNEYLTVQLAKVKQMSNNIEVEVDNPENNTGFDIVKSNTFTSIDENELSQLQNDYENMLSSGNDVLFKTAMAMYAYAIVKDGHMFKAGGLLQILPNNIMKEFMNNLTIVKELFAENDEGAFNMRKLNNKLKEEFTSKFGLNLFELTKEFSQMYLENFNNRDNIKKIKGITNDSKTVTRTEENFTVDIFKNVKQREYSTEEIDALIALNVSPSKFPEGFFEQEFGLRLKELNDKGFQLFPTEENGKKRWKILFPYVLKTSFKDPDSGYVSNHFYKLKSINLAKNTNFAEFYDNDMRILSDTAEYERIELNGGYQLSSISGMFGELPKVIRSKIQGESAQARESRQDDANKRYMEEMGFLDDFEFEDNETAALDQLSTFEESLNQNPVIKQPKELDTPKSIIQDNRIRKDYPAQIAGINISTLISLSNLDNTSKDILSSDYFLQKGVMSKEFGQSAEDYAFIYSTEFSREEAQFFKDNDKEMSLFLDIFENDERVSSDMNAQEFATLLLSDNETLVDTAQLDLFSSLPEIKTTKEDKCN